MKNKNLRFISIDKSITRLRFDLYAAHRDLVLNTKEYLSCEDIVSKLRKKLKKLNEKQK